jgi:hypothetical protein
MSVRYDSLVPALKALLPEQALGELGRAVAFIRRLRELRASVFVWSVVLSRFGGGRPAFEQARQWYQRLAGNTFAPRPFQLRFKCESAVRLFEQVFDSAVKPWRGRTRSRHPLALRFPDVAVVDSTLLQVSDDLREVYKGTWRSAASLKVLLTISIFGLLPLHAKMAAANVHDMQCFPELGMFQAGTLLMFDKGFASYQRLSEIVGASLHYLCPMRANGNALIVGIRRAPKHVREALRRCPQGIRLRDVLKEGRKISDEWDIDVILASGAEKGRPSVRTPSRVVIVPGPDGKQRPYTTSLESSEWTPKAIAELYRLRWQVELVFKELKQHLNLEALNSRDEHAVKVFAYASLLALALSRTVTTWLCPRIRLVGLESRFRPALTSRALRSMCRTLASALTATPRQARALLVLIADELLLETRTRDQDREDSFSRLLPLLPGA